MPIVTTQSVANPKPVRGVNWCGNPMAPGDDYWGTSTKSEDRGNDPAVSAPAPRKAKHKRKPWTAEKRQAYAARMREWWAARKAQPGPVT